MMITLIMIFKSFIKLFVFYITLFSFSISAALFDWQLCQKDSDCINAPGICNDFIIMNKNQQVSFTTYFKELEKIKSCHGKSKIKYTPVCAVHPKHKVKACLSLEYVDMMKKRESKS